MLVTRKLRCRLIQVVMLMLLTLTRRTEYAPRIKHTYVLVGICIVIVRRGDNTEWSAELRVNNGARRENVVAWSDYPGYLVLVTGNRWLGGVPIPIKAVHAFGRTKLGT